jgi:hypothetical protein
MIVDKFDIFLLNKISKKFQTIIPFANQVEWGWEMWNTLI